MTGTISISSKINNLEGHAARKCPDFVAQPLIDSPTVENLRGVPHTMQHDDERPGPKEEPDKTPDTPTDEPKPAPVQDPPSEPDPAPYVVRSQSQGGPQ